MSGRTQAYGVSLLSFQASSAPRRGSNGAAGRSGPMPSDHDPAWNRDEAQKPPPAPGAAPRMAQEPAGAEGSSDTPKTHTDPASGESSGAPHAPNQAKTDQTAGAGQTRATAKARNLPPA